MEGDLGWCCSSGNNWDLHAVVRFACGGASRVAPPPPSSVDFPISWQLSPQTDELMADAAAWQPLTADPAAADDLCQALSAAPVPPKPQTPQQPSLPSNKSPDQQPPPVDQSPAKPKTSGRAGRSKRKSKKSHVEKEVTRVPVGAPAEADPWAWRKYGQKPIKGSPYPRGYYRCSTDKDCKARKQTERCLDDPDTLVVTYTGEHSHAVPLHRSSLAGTTRRTKQQSPPSPSTAEESPQPQASSSASVGCSLSSSMPQSSPSASAGLSPTTSMCSPSVGYKEDAEDDALAVSWLLLEDAEIAADGDDALLFLRS